MNAVICHGIKTKEAFDKMTVPMCAEIWYPWLQQYYPAFQHNVRLLQIPICRHATIQQMPI